MQRRRYNYIESPILQTWFISNVTAILPSICLTSLYSSLNWLRTSEEKMDVSHSIAKENSNINNTNTPTPFGHNLEVSSSSHYADSASPSPGSPPISWQPALPLRHYVICKVSCDFLNTKANGIDSSSLTPCSPSHCWTHLTSSTVLFSTYILVWFLLPGVG